MGILVEQKLISMEEKKEKWKEIKNSATYTFGANVLRAVYLFSIATQLAHRQMH